MVEYIPPRALLPNLANVSSFSRALALFLGARDDRLLPVMFRCITCGFLGAA